MSQDASTIESVNARIVYWGVPGAGVSASLRTIQTKLRGGGTLRRIPTALDPTIEYEVLPISLGKVNGLATEIEIVAVPSDDSHGPTRKQLLDRVDGMVFVADATPGRLEENQRCLAELREALDAYGRSTNSLPIVVQYNKRDLADPYAIEELHRSVAIPGAAVFESVATEGSGVLQALTTICKRVIRARRDELSRASAASLAEVTPVVDATPIAEAPPIAEPIPIPDPPAAREPEPLLEAAPLEEPPQALSFEAAILAEGEHPAEAEASAQAAFDAEALFDRPFEELAREAKASNEARIGSDFEIVSIGSASRSGPRSVRVPLVLGNPEGETVSMALSIALDPVLDEAEE